MQVVTFADRETAAMFCWLTCRQLNDEKAGIDLADAAKFPKEGNEHHGCEWSEVTAQTVPPHIGSPTPGCGYEDGDPYAAFLPPAFETNADGAGPFERAVIFVTEYSSKGTTRSPQDIVTSPPPERFFNAFPPKVQDNCHQTIVTSG